MAFWGTEVKPGKPFIHKPDNGRERLHISQATLGNGNGEKKSVVQCNVGDKSPVFLCSLFPEQSESCQLNLEFDESDDVIFSVIGPRSVHLSGYYLPGSSHYSRGDESESYGEDIADTETERSGDRDIEDEDEYDDSFIDDDDLQVIGPSPVSVDEEMLQERKSKKKKGNFKRLRKSYQIQSDEDDTNVDNDKTELDSDSEDKLVISSLCKTILRSQRSETEENAKKRTVLITDEVKDGDDNSTMLEQKPDSMVDGERGQQEQHDSVLRSAGMGLENGTKPKEKKKKHLKKEKETKAGIDYDFFRGTMLECDQAGQHKTAVQSEMKIDQSSQNRDVKIEDNQRIENDRQPEDHEYLMHSAEDRPEKSAKPKRKKKKQSKKKKEHKANTENDSVFKLEQVQQNETTEQSVNSVTVNDERGQKIKESKNDGTEDGAFLKETQVLPHEVEADQSSAGVSVKDQGQNTRERKELDIGTEADSFDGNQAQKSETKANQSSQNVDVIMEDDQRVENDKHPEDHEFLMCAAKVSPDKNAKPKRKKKKQPKEKKEHKAEAEDDSLPKLEHFQQNEMKTDQPVNSIIDEDEKDHKTKEKKNARAEDDALLKENLVLPNEMEADQSCAGVSVINHDHETIEKKELNIGAEDDSVNVNQVQQNETQTDQLSQDIAFENEDQKTINDKKDSKLLIAPPAAGVVLGIAAMPVKRKKTVAKKGKNVRAKGTLDDSVNGEDKAEMNDSKGGNVEKDALLENEENQNQANNENVDFDPQILASLEEPEDDSRPKRKRKARSEDNTVAAEANSWKKGKGQSR